MESAEKAYSRIKDDPEKMAEYIKVYHAYVHKLFSGELAEALAKVIPVEVHDLTAIEYKQAAYAAKVFVLGMTELYISSEAANIEMSNMLSKAVNMLDLMNANPEFVTEARRLLSKV